MIRHFTSSAIVFDDQDRVLLVHHNKLDVWLYPGGHVDPNEDPVEAALREVREETGIQAEIIGPRMFHHQAVRTIPTPFTIIEMAIDDREVGPHRHIDFVYVCQSDGSDVVARVEEVARVEWFPIDSLTSLRTPKELPELVTYAARWASEHAAGPSTVPAG